MEVKEEDFLLHFGTKGMKWGVRKDNRAGASRATDKAARKDAEEFARAKLFYGEGAGTRRKLIKATVEAKSKRDPDYKKAFDRHLGNQDMSRHATKATKERTVTDRRTKRKQRAGYFARRLTGEMGTQAAFAAAAVAGAAFLNSPRGRALGRQVVGQARNVVNDQKVRKGADYLSDYFARNG